MRGFKIEVCTRMTMRKLGLRVRGSGTSLISAQKLDRKYIGYEIVRNYCEIAKNKGLNIHYFTDNLLKSRDF